MVAPRDLKNSPRVGEHALFNVLHPRPVHSHWDLVFRLASYRARVAPDTLAIVDYKAVFHPLKRPPPKTNNHTWKQAESAPGICLQKLYSEVRVKKRTREFRQARASRHEKNKLSSVERRASPPGLNRLQSPSLHRYQNQNAV
jgi:hypothetical protein